MTAVLAIIDLSQRYWNVAVSAIFGVAALVLLVGNLSDLGHGWRRGGSMGEDAEDKGAGQESGLR
jgi:hypothetical protein